MLEALTFASKIAGYLSRDWLEMDMTEGIKKLLAHEPAVSDQCLMTFMGNWGGSILQETAVPDVDFVATGWPGATHLHGVPRRGVPHGERIREREPRRRLVRYDRLGSRTDRFRRAGRGAAGSQVRSDPEQLDPLVKKDMADRANGEVLAGYTLIAKSSYPFDPLANAVNEFLQSHDLDKLSLFLKDNYER